MAKLPLCKFIFISIFLLTIIPTYGKGTKIDIASDRNFHNVSFELLGDLIFYPEKKATAFVKPINHALVPAQISAQVNHVNVLIGDKVKSGQVLVNLDCQDKEIILARQYSQYALSQAKLEFAQRNYDRSLKLKKNKNIGEADIDASKVEVTIAKETLANALLDKQSASLSVSRCKIVAPFDGVVTQRTISEGDYVNVGQGIIQVLQLNNLEVEAQIPIEQLDDFQQAHQYYFIKGIKKTPLKVNNIVDFISMNSQSKIVTFSSYNISSAVDKTPTIDTLELVAGLNGMVSWYSKQGFLPSHLLTQRNGQYGIFIAESDKSNETNKYKVAKFIPLPQAQEGRPFKIDLPKNTQVIIDGRHRVNQNDSLQINTLEENNSSIKDNKD
ncbi:MAG: efflux RND transporter periplasmic adaptor subunit [Colwellia sp.]